MRVEQRSMLLDDSAEGVLISSASSLEELPLVQRGC
jgi:hypothetical protein